MSAAFASPPSLAERTSSRSAAPAAASAPPAPSPRVVRDASVDVARTWCLVVVVALHSLMVGVSMGAHGPILENALEGWSLLPAVTWFVQIMPLFFVLGGFSSFTQWGRMRAQGASASDYVAGRMQRLLRPAIVAVAVIAVGLSLLTLAGLPADIVAAAGFHLSQPLWFLGVYIVCTALVPALSAAHRRAPVLSMIVLAATVLAVDVIRQSTGITVLGFLNLAFVWLLVQQFGFWLAEGCVSRLSRRSLVALAAGAYATLAILASCGVYSFDMLENLNPPTLALVLLGIAQLALFELLRPSLRRLHESRPIAAVVAAMSARAMTVYLWHMSVLIALAGALLLSGAHLPTPLSAGWWWSRPIWMLAVAVVVTATVALAGRFEMHAPPMSRGQRAGTSSDGTRARTSISMGRSQSGAALGALGIVVILITGFSVAGGVAACALLAAALRLTNTNARFPDGPVGHPVFPMLR